MTEDEVREAHAIILDAIPDLSTEVILALDRIVEQAWRYANLLD